MDGASLTNLFASNGAELHYSGQLHFIKSQNKRGYQTMTVIKDKEIKEDAINFQNENNKKNKLVYWSKI